VLIVAGRTANVTSATPSPNLAYDVSVGNNAAGGTVSISANMRGLYEISGDALTAAAGDLQILNSGTLSLQGSSASVSSSRHLAMTGAGTLEFVHQPHRHHR
jgi:hypothetical protein